MSILPFDLSKTSVISNTHSHRTVKVFTATHQNKSLVKLGRHCGRNILILFISSGESRPVHLQLHHPERRSPTGLCPESPDLLSLHTRLCVLSQLHFYHQIRWWFFGFGPPLQPLGERRADCALCVEDKNESREKKVSWNFRSEYLGPCDISVFRF